MYPHSSFYFLFFSDLRGENPLRQEALTKISTRPGARERRGRAFVFNNASAAALSLTFRTNERLGARVRRVGPLIRRAALSRALIYSAGCFVLSRRKDVTYPEG